MLAYFKQLVNALEGNMTKYYLITANIVMVVFAVWFSNVGLLPFKNSGDFAFFVVLSLILALYRPGWTFLFFIGTLVLENINLAPKGLGLSLRPYQFFGFITIIALLVQFASKRVFFSLPRWGWYDALPIVFVLAGFLSSLGAINKGASFKQSVIALSFVALYFLVRIYVQSLEDLKRIAPFFLSSGFVVMVYAVWQNIIFLSGGNSFEVMPGRPNATFTEADWLGVFLVFLLAVILTIIYALSKKSSVTSNQSSNQLVKKVNPMTDVLHSRISLEQNRLLITGNYAKQILAYIFLCLIFTTLILTVSRSAWVGAVFVMLVFLKSMLLRNYEEFRNGEYGKWASLLEILKMRQWQWKNAGLQLLFILIALGVALMIVMPLTRFQLTDRVVSTGGLQKITISCPASIDLVIPQKVNSLDDIKPCQHINLEDIAKERALGNVIMEVNRPDPNVNIRAEIYQKSWQQIKAHPILGLGWGGISSVLGSDERGAGLNASNIFLEVWLGAGLIGFLSFVILVGYIMTATIGAFLDNNENKNGSLIAFVMLGWAAVVIPNLFNSGIFLGFVWCYLAVAISLLTKTTK